MTTGSFSVHLPIVTTAGSLPNVARVPEPYGGQRVLIVDDNRDAADAMASLLELEGNETHVAHDGESALELAESLRPAVIVLDIGLPGLNGYEVARLVRAKAWGASVLLLALTGWGHPDDRARSIDAGFDQHLVKPVEVSTLSELLARHAGRQIV